MGLLFGKKKKIEEDMSEYDYAKLYEKAAEWKDNGDVQYTETRQQKLVYAENCCDQMIMCQRRLEEAKKNYREVNHYLTDISTIENLQGTVKDSLLLEAKKICSLKEDKKSYKTSAVKMSEQKYEYIRSHEEEMPKIIKNLKESEEDLQAIKTDLHNVEGEKSALKYERKTSIQHMNGMRKLLKFVLAVTAALLVFFTVGQFRGVYDYTIGYYITVVTAIAAIAMILAFHRQQEKNLRVAEIKLNKVIGLLNKCKLRYVNIKSSVDYMYETYGVSNSYELGNLWSRYITAKKEREAYFTMSDNLYRATEEYMDIIRSLNLYDSSVWAYQMEALTDEDKMTEIKEVLRHRREGIKKNIDYNSELIAREKDNIKKIIEEEPSLAEDIISMIDKKEKEL